jgi:peptidyl-dipeptidase A
MQAVKKSALILTTAGLVACAGAQKEPSNVPAASPPPAHAGKAPAAQNQKSASKPTADDARAFAAKAEQSYLKLAIAAERAHWIKATYITVDTQKAAADAEGLLSKNIAQLASGAVKFKGIDAGADVARKFTLLRLAPSLPVPSDDGRRKALTNAVVSQQGTYGKGAYCPDGKTRLRIKSKAKGKKCYSLGQLSKRMRKSRNYDELLEIWRGWRRVSRPMRKTFPTYVSLANEGAKQLGFSSVAALWKSRFDLQPDAFEKEVDRLFEQVKPLYRDLHCYVRSRLQKKYGKKRVPDGRPIPAHLLGNMWAQDWGHISELVMPKGSRAIDLDRALARKRFDAVKMVRAAEAFFVSLGMDKLPDTFWKRSMFVKPKDRDVVCHASAWAIDYADDLRIKMCIDINSEDFTTIHHELGHIYYYHHYKDLPPLYRDSANKGFHEGLGDTISLSVTPGYLKSIGLIKRDSKDDIGPLMLRALEKVAFLPFGLLIDKWRWDVFSGKVKPADYNKHWWELRRRYQGVMPPVARSEKDFDPGAKYHVAANVPYVRYFLAHILQFQFHRALCKVAGHQGPLHRCSIYKNKAAGQRLMAMMRLGLSKPWPDALEALTGKRQMDATAILGYFAPLHDWLKKQNKGKQCGW